MTGSKRLAHGFGGVRCENNDLGQAADLQSPPIDPLAKYLEIDVESARCCH